MKKVKFIISVFLVLFCLILNSELFQNYINSISDNLYFFYTDFTDSISEEEIGFLEELSTQYNTEMLLIKTESVSTYETRVTLFVNDESRAWLQKQGITDGTFKSLFSGQTTVFIDELINAAADGTVYKCHLTCSGSTASEIRDAFNQKYGASSYAYRNSEYNLKWAAPACMAVCAALLLLLTWLDIQFQKKENFVEMSLGKAPYKIIIRNIVLDAGVFAAVALIIYAVLTRFAYVSFMQNVIILIFAAFLLLNSVMYVPFTSFDYKEALYGANVRVSLLSNSYVIKAIVTIITVAVLGTNLIAVSENAGYLIEYSHIKDNLSNYSFMKLNFTASPADDAEEEDPYESERSLIENELFARYYNAGKVALAGNDYDGDEYEFILMNENSSGLAADIIEQAGIDPDADFTIFVPESYEMPTEEDLYYDLLYPSGYNLFPEESFPDITYTIKTYKSRANVTYITRTYNDSTLVNLGFDSALTPIIGYCNIENIDAEIGTQTFELTYGMDELIMYSLTEEDISDINEYLAGINASYGDRSPDFSITLESVTERCGENMNVFSRITLLNTVVSVFLLALDFAIILTVIKMQYKVSAMELALKKILGYSILQRNKTLLELNLFSAMIGIITVLIAALMLQLDEWYMVLITGALLLIIEYTVIFYYILKTERKNIPGILKGGSL